MKKFTFILTRPQMAENIGAAARAMANFGLASLRLVAPRDGWPNDDALPMASGGFDYLDDVQVFDTLGEALADCHISFATTARPRDMQKEVYRPKQALDYCAQTMTEDARIAIVFGAERTGLTNEEIALCHAIIEAPTAPEFSSLNLAQCVLMMAYEIASQGPRAVVQSPLTPAPQNEFESFFSRLIEALELHGFFKEPHLRPKIERNLRTLFLRPNHSTQELNSLHGIISALTRNSR